VAELPFHAHQIASGVIRARVQVVEFRDHEGAVRHSVEYRSASSRWISAHRFETTLQADAAALVLREWLGSR
jgi:hypothetical protein